MMMIQEQPPLPQPHMEERLLSFTLLSYGGIKKVLRIMKIKENESKLKETNDIFDLNHGQALSLTLFDLDFFPEVTIIKVKESQRQF